MIQHALIRGARPRSGLASANEVGYCREVPVLRKNVVQTPLTAPQPSGGKLHESIFMMQPAQHRRGNHSVSIRNLMSGSGGSLRSHARIRNPWLSFAKTPAALIRLTFCASGPDTSQA